MKHAARRLAALPLLGGLALAPSPAQALTEIPFYVTNRYGAPLCVQVNGPWLRIGGTAQPVPQGVADRNFYSAEINTFSPYGSWYAEIYVSADPNECRIQKSRDGLIDRTVFYTVFFCVLDFESRANITLVPNADEERRVDFKVEFPPYNLQNRCGGRDFQGESGTPVVAAAHLGHEPAPGAAAPAAGAVAAAAGAGRPAGSKARLGSDHFRFEGRAGDTVELALERDGARGSTGELTRLSLHGERGKALGQRQGSVPLELTATLPAAGHYQIEVAEVVGGSGGEPFRGHYRLRLSSASGAPVLLEPLRSVEP